MFTSVVTNMFATLVFQRHLEAHIGVFFITGYFHAKTLGYKGLETAHRNVVNSISSFSAKLNVSKLGVVIAILEIKVNSIFQALFQL